MLFHKKRVSEPREDSAPFICYYLSGLFPFNHINVLQEIRRLGLTYFTLLSHLLLVMEKVSTYSAARVLSKYTATSVLSPTSLWLGVLINHALSHLPSLKIKTNDDFSKCSLVKL